MIWYKKTSDFPAFYSDYLDKIKKEGFSNDIISIDIETTGLNPKKDKILSFGSIPIVNDKIVPGKEYEVYFNDHKEIKNTHIHEILPVESRVSFKDFIPKLLELIGNKTILGHYLVHDLSFINYQLKDMGLPKLKNPTIDTLNVALKQNGIHNLQYVRKEDYALYKLCTKNGITIHNTHNALEDAYMTALLYLHIARK